MRFREKIVQCLNLSTSYCLAPLFRSSTQLIGHSPVEDAHYETASASDWQVQTCTYICTHCRHHGIMAHSYNIQLLCRQVPSTYLYTTQKVPSSQIHPLCCVLSTTHSYIVKYTQVLCICTYITWCLIRLTKNWLTGIQPENFFDTNT